MIVITWSRWIYGSYIGISAETGFRSQGAYPVRLPFRKPLPKNMEELMESLPVVLATGSTIHYGEAK